MQIITFEDIQKLNIDPLTCYQWVSEMIAEKEKTILPPKISLKPREGVFCNVMPCILDEKQVGGVKIVNRYPERQPSLDSKLLLLDTKTGEFLALMDANWITAMRTGAVAAHSVMHLAKRDFHTVGMVGLGNTARAFLLVLTAIIKDKPLQIKLLRHKKQEMLFMERFKDCPNLNFTCVDAAEDLVRGTDVIVSCVTYFDSDFCSDDCFDEGVLLVPVHTRGFGNCDLFFDKVYADDYGHVCHFKNFDRFRYFAEISALVNGRAIGRENDKERILAYNIGLSIHDVYYAWHIYQLLQGINGLQAIDMHTPTEKFWI